MGHLQTGIGAVVAASLAAVLGAGLALRRTADVREAGERYRHTLAVANGRYLAAAPLSSQAGDRAGTLFLYQGSPSWGLLAVSTAPVDGDYTVTMTEHDGSVQQLGACEVVHRRATCSFPLGVAVGKIAVVNVASPAGPVLTATK